MVKAQNVNNSVNLVKAISKEELLEFAKEYLETHIYISNKKLSSTYIGEHYDLGYRDLISIRIRKTLSSRFTYSIMLLHREGLIAKYNNSNLYKKIDFSD